MTRWPRPRETAYPTRRSSTRRLVMAPVTPPDGTPKRIGDTVADQSVQRALLVRTTLELLRDAGGPLQPREAVDEIERRVQFTPYELERPADGQPRWRI